MPTPMAGSTRWCPTPEQLMILEEMYRGGLRTPNASQIQQITAHLAHYGRIEGKNVFYWFQNHKARDRQKLRRRLCMSHHLLSCAHYYAHQHHLLGAALPTAAQYYSSPGLDQQYSGTPAAAYSAGYGYPLGGAAPASRCAGAPNNPLFPSYQGASVLPEYSLGRLGNFGVAEDACPASTTAGTPMTEDQAMSAPPFCRPLKTLDLFPGALKEEQRDVV